MRDKYHHATPWGRILLDAQNEHFPEGKLLTDLEYLNVERLDGETLIDFHFHDDSRLQVSVKTDAPFRGKTAFSGCSLSNLCRLPWYLDLNTRGQNTDGFTWFLNETVLVDFSHHVSQAETDFLNQVKWYSSVGPGLFVVHNQLGFNQLTAVHSKRFPENTSHSSPFPALVTVKHYPEQTYATLVSSPEVISIGSQHMPDFSDIDWSKLPVELVKKLLMVSGKEHMIAFKKECTLCAKNGRASVLDNDVAKCPVDNNMKFSDFEFFRGEAEDFELIRQMMRERMHEFGHIPMMTYTSAVRTPAAVASLG